MRQEQPQESHRSISTVAKRLDVHPATLRLWVNQAEVDKGARPGTTTADAARIAELERENRELRRANEILKAASAFMPTWRLCRLPVVLVGVVAVQGGWQLARRSA
jgi:transposase